MQEHSLSDIVHTEAAVTFVERSYYSNKDDTVGDEAPLGKVMRFNSDGTIEKAKDSAKPTYFDFKVVPVANLDELFIAIKDGVNNRGVRALVQGAPYPWSYGKGPVVRRYAGDDATLRDISRPYMIFDVDFDEAVEGVDISDAVKVGEYTRRLLPPMFHDVRCISSLSAGHGRDGVIRNRLIFWLDKPLSMGLQKAIADTAELTIDRSIYHPAAIVYLTFHRTDDSVVDPFKGKRWRMLDGAPQVITPTIPEIRAMAPKLDLAARKGQAKKEGDKIGRKIIVGSFDEICLLFGDPKKEGDVKHGFFNPMTDAIKAFYREAWRRGEVPNPEECEKKLAAVMQAAHAKPGRGKAKEAYITELAAHIKRLFAYEDRKRIAALKPSGVEVVTLDEASRIVNSVVVEVVGDTVRANLIDRPEHSVFDDDADMPVYDWGYSAPKKGAAHLIKVTVGAGKTHSAINGVASAVALDLRCAWIAPTRKLAQEAKARLTAAGVDAKVWYGVESEPDEREGHACAYPDLMKIGFSIGCSVKDVCFDCDQRADCFYPCQDVRGASCVIFAGPAYLHGIPNGARNPQRRFEQFDLVVIDEAPVGTFVGDSALTFHKDDFTLSMPKGFPTGDEDTAAEGLRRMAKFAALFSGNTKTPTYSDLLRTVGYMSEPYWESTEKLLRAAMSDPAKLIREERRKNERKEEKLWNKHVLKLIKLARIMRVLAAESKQCVDVCVEQARVRIDGEELHALGKKEIHDDWLPSSKIILDATADAELLAKCIGTELESITDLRVEYPRQVRIVQVDFQYGYNWLGITKEAQREAPAARAAKYGPRFKALRSFVQQLSGFFYGGETAVVGPRQIIHPLDAKGNRIEGAGLCDGLGDRVTAAWFGNLRGLDSMRNVKNLIIISRPQPRTEDLEQMAESLTGSPVWHADRLEAKDSYRRVKAAGGGEGLAPARRYRHPNSLAERVHQQATLAELQQAIGRGRGVRRREGEPLNIWILTDTALDDFAVELLDVQTFDDRVNNGVQSLLAEGIAVERYGGRRLMADLLDMNPTTLRNKLPDFAPEGRNVQEWLDAEREVLEVLDAIRYHIATAKAEGAVWTAAESPTEVQERLNRVAGRDVAATVTAAPLTAEQERLREKDRRRRK